MIATRTFFRGALGRRRGRVLFSGESAVMLILWLWMMEESQVSLCCSLHFDGLRRWRNVWHHPLSFGRVTAHHARTKLGVLIEILRWAGVMRLDAAVLRCETKRQRHIELRE